jgi:hypothetical protein
MPSHVIKFFKYDEERSILTVGFTSGSLYQYFGVPAGLYRRFKAAFSKGQFFSEYIRDAYSYKKIDQ